MVHRSDAPAAPERHLGVFDAVCVVVGVVVGSFIFFLGPHLVAQNTTSPATMLLAWVFGGFLCLCGALSYAELATAYPRTGGDAGPPPDGPGLFVTSPAHLATTLCNA